MRGPHFTTINILIDRSYQYLSNDLLMVSAYSLCIEFLWFLLLCVLQFIAENSIIWCEDHISLQFIFQWVDLTSIYLFTNWWSAHIHCAFSYRGLFNICLRFIAEYSITRCADHTSWQFIFQWVDFTSIYLMIYLSSALIHCALLRTCDFSCLLFFSV